MLSEITLHCDSVAGADPQGRLDCAPTGAAHNRHADAWCAWPLKLPIVKMIWFPTAFAQ
jgi:hypothetical protein